MTSPPLTIVDLAGVRTEAQLGRMLDDAVRSGLCRPDHVGEWVVRLAGSRHAGIGTLRAVLRARGAGVVIPESELEVRMFDVLRGPGIPELRRQVRFPWRPELSSRADALAVGLPLILEADGRAWHARLEQMAVDRERDNDALAHGFLTMRFTHLQLTDHADAARAAVRATVAHWGTRVSVR